MFEEISFNTNNNKDNNNNNNNNNRGFCVILMNSLKSEKLSETSEKTYIQEFPLQIKWI